MTQRMTLEDARIIVAGSRHDGYALNYRWLHEAAPPLRPGYLSAHTAWHRLATAAETIQRHLPVLVNDYLWPERSVRHAFEWYLEGGWIQAQLDRPEHEQGWNLDYLWRRLKS